MRAPILIIKLGDTSPEIAAAHGDFEDWVRAGLDAAGTGLPVEVLDPRADAGATLPRIIGVASSAGASASAGGNMRAGADAHAEAHAGGARADAGAGVSATGGDAGAIAAAGVVLTGSHAMVTDREPWSEATARWLARLVAADAAPVLGICYGHQLLAHALGGEAGWHPRGDELGNAAIRLRPEADDDALFAGFPRVFSAAVSHSQTVPRLPPGAVLLAENDFEPHHAFRVGARAWGVQFHPEFSADISRLYLDCAGAGLRAEGRDLAAVRAGIEATPFAASVLPRFARIAAAGAGHGATDVTRL
jgi:GMP synthase (glutamine-hydrolysing)